MVSNKPKTPLPVCPNHEPFSYAEYELALPLAAADDVAYDDAVVDGVYCPLLYVEEAVAEEDEVAYEEAAAAELELVHVLDEDVVVVQDEPVADVEAVAEAGAVVDAGGVYWPIVPLAREI